MDQKTKVFQFPGIRAAMDGNSAIISSERESSDAAGAFPITPSTQMGEYWAEAAAKGHLNISQRPLIFIEPEGEHASAAVTAGLSMTGLRSANFSSGQGVAYMHESLYAAVGKRLTYILNMGCRAMTKATLNVHAGHDDYHCVDDTGFFQLFAKNAQHAADLNIIAHRIAELALNPGIVAQDGFLTTHLIESMLAPERELIARYLGRPEDIIDTPTAAQRMIFGAKRRRVPALWDVDSPVMAGVVQNQDSYMQMVAAQRPFFFDHIKGLSEQAFDEFYQLSGRQYQRVMSYRVSDADYIILGQGSVVSSAEVVADYLRETRGLKVGVINLLMFRPFPSDLLGRLLQGKTGVVVLERVDQPLAVDLPLIREIRACLSQCLENGISDHHPFAELPAYQHLHDMPQLYSGCFGLGSRDLQAEGFIAAVENMLPEGEQLKRFYLGIDFIHDQVLSPKMELHQQSIEEAYPDIAKLSLHGSENPNLLPANSITVRFHSVGGWGAITTGKNLAMTLFDLLGYHIKANPKYGSEKKGQPTTYYLSAAPEPIRMNCEYVFVDVVLSPDPNVFQHTNALVGLKKGGVFIIQSDLLKATQVWASIPANYQKIIVENGYRVFFLDGFKIAREEATDPELELRMQGIAFQGAFFKASPVMAQAGFDEARLLEAIKLQLQHKFGAKGARVVEDNLRVVKRGYDELQEIIDKPLADAHSIAVPIQVEAPLPNTIKCFPQAKVPYIDIHRFWEQTGSLYARGKANDNLTDPFIALGSIPVSSTLFRDMTGIRFRHPQWIPENCTACGDCYVVCPDTSIPGLVNTIDQVFDTVVKRVRQAGHEINYLQKFVRKLEPTFRSRLREASENVSVSEQLQAATEQTREAMQSDDIDATRLHQELEWFNQALGDFQFAVTRPYFTLAEKKQAGSGGLFSITINPLTCKGCEECIEVCKDDALRSLPQTKDSVQRLRKNWEFWQELPSTAPQYFRYQDLEQRIGALDTLLLDKSNYLSFASGDGACMGCSEKTVMHLFIATVEALMQTRVKQHLEYLDDLILRLERHIQLKIVQEINVDDTEAIQLALNQIGSGDITLSGIANQIETLRGSHPIDQVWLRFVTALLNKLKHLAWLYREGNSGMGRTSMGIVNSTGCSSVWGSTYPYNPYPFPWANHLFQDSPSIAMGVFEGHMAKMADGFKAIRIAELELAGHYLASEHQAFFDYFNWKQFSDEEYQLCPPVVVVGGDGAMYDIGFQNLSRAMMAGKPLKIVVLDTQVYSNTGGQACTSGFFGQVSDMAPYGEVTMGKQEQRKEIGLIAMAHRGTYVMQSTIAHSNHMIEGFIEGLQSKRPALFNCYSSCQPEHAIGDDMGRHQARLAVESRAYPLFRYNPDAGDSIAECFDLSGNPAQDDVWPQYQLHYQEAGLDKRLNVAMTFADFAATEGRFRKHFRSAPRDSWHADMMALDKYLSLPSSQREGKFPYINAVNKEQKLTRLLVSDTIVTACEDRRQFWSMLKELARVQAPSGEADMQEKIRQDLLAKISAGISQWLGGEALALAQVPASAGGADVTPVQTPRVAGGDYLAPWIDSDECTTCDECTMLNPNIFAYDDNRHAFIKNPTGGPYSDLVKAAERCTGQIIHPGLPGARQEKDLDKWIARAEKYN